MRKKGNFLKTDYKFNDFEKKKSKFLVSILFTAKKQ